MFVFVESQLLELFMDIKVGRFSKCMSIKLKFNNNYCADPLNDSISHASSSTYSTGILWAFATLSCLFIAVLVVAGVIFYFSRRRKLAAEADEFDVEFGDDDDE